MLMRNTTTAMQNLQRISSSILCRNFFFQKDDKQVKNKRKKQMKGTKQGYRETTIVNNHPREKICFSHVTERQQG